MDEKKVPLSDSPPYPQELGIPGQSAPSTYIKPQARKPHDPDVTFEEYHYYALRTREDQKDLEAPKTDWKGLLLRKKKKPTEIEAVEPHLSSKDFSNPEHRLEISDEEWTNASRAFRTASWGACERFP